MRIKQAPISLAHPPGPFTHECAVGPAYTGTNRRPFLQFHMQQVPSAHAHTVGSVIICI